MSESLSTRYILMHPCRTRAAIENMQEELSSAQSAYMELAERNDTLRKEIKTLKEERSALQASNTESGLKYKRLKEEYDSLQAEIGEVHALFEKVSEMKQAYERKIERYKCKVADLKRDLKRLEEATQSEIAPMPTIPIPGKNKRQEPEPQRPTEREPADDWYLPLDI